MYWVGFQQLPDLLLYRFSETTRAGTAILQQCLYCLLKIISMPYIFRINTYNPLDFDCEMKRAKGRSNNVCTEPKLACRNHIFSSLKLSALRFRFVPTSFALDLPVKL